MKGLTESCRYILSMRVALNHLHGLLIALAIVRARTKKVVMLQPSCHKYPKFYIVTVELNLYRRTSLSTHDLVHGLHYLMTAGTLCLDDITLGRA